MDHLFVIGRVDCTVLLVLPVLRVLLRQMRNWGLQDVQARTETTVGAPFPALR